MPSVVEIETQPEFHTLTHAQALEYCKGSETQEVRKEIARRVGARSVLDLCCGNGIDAENYDTTQYTGFDFSIALIVAARELHPKHQFEVHDARDLSKAAIDKVPACVIIKSALEHVPSEADAVAIFRSALETAREIVFVAWHTPPLFLDTARIHRVPGHFGFTVYQNRYRREPFLAQIPKSATFRTERVGIFDLWTVEL